MRDYAAKRNWTVAIEVQDVASGATTRPQRETLIAAARRREIDCVLVWRLDRWGRSLVDLVNSLQELTSSSSGFSPFPLGTKRDGQVSEVTPLSVLRPVLPVVNQGVHELVIVRHRPRLWRVTEENELLIRGHELAAVGPHDPVDRRDDRVLEAAAERS